MELQQCTANAMLNVAFERFYCSYQKPNVASMLGHSLRRWAHIEILLDIGLCILI